MRMTKQYREVSRMDKNVVYRTLRNLIYSLEQKSDGDAWIDAGCVAHNMSYKDEKATYDALCELEDDGKAVQHKEKGTASLWRLSQQAIQYESETNGNFAGWVAQA